MNIQQFGSWTEQQNFSLFTLAHLAIQFNNRIVVYLCGNKNSTLKKINYIDNDALPSMTNWLKIIKLF